MRNLVYIKIVLFALCTAFSSAHAVQESWPALGEDAIKLLDPRIQEKDISENLEQLALACLEQGDAEKAQAISGRISDWRRGVVYTKLAVQYDRQGEKTLSERYFLLASEWRKFIAQQQKDGTMGWGADRIGRYMAEAYIELGQYEKAGQIAAEIGGAYEVMVANRLLIHQPGAVTNKTALLVAQLVTKNTEMESSVSHSLAALLASASNEEEISGIIHSIQRGIEDLPLFMRADVLEALFAGMGDGQLQSVAVQEILPLYEGIVQQLSGGPFIHHSMVIAAVLKRMGNQAAADARIAGVEGYLGQTKGDAYRYIYLFEFAEGLAANGFPEQEAALAVQDCLAELGALKSPRFFVQGTVDIICLLMRQEAPSNEKLFAQIESMVQNRSAPVRGEGIH